MIQFYTEFVLIYVNINTIIFNIDQKKRMFPCQMLFLLYNAWCCVCCFAIWCFECMLILFCCVQEKLECFVVIGIVTLNFVMQYDTCDCDYKRYYFEFI